MKHNLFIFLLLIYGSLCQLQGQNCYDAGFESGTVGGYTSYTGSINELGVLDINNLEVSPIQHKIMHVSDGYDLFVSEFCGGDYKLPVVAPDGGQYSVRLGTHSGGSHAERLVLKFLVTEENSFFLLKYAVVLEDPDHEEFEQPRFELRIQDANGVTFPCGEYKVRAGPEIPDFQNCGDWRVQNWTTAGFELKSYIGQEIQIEMLTSDCSRGGHGGYAYLDAGCQPLEIKLSGFCPESIFANISVTEGFSSYEWSTGEAGSEIIVDNPEPGDIYHVTITSATGCTLVLSDTLPPYGIFPIPSFDSIESITLCNEPGIVVKPTGRNLGDIECLELGIISEEFYLRPEKSTIYTFVTSDPNGCGKDTVRCQIYVFPSITEVFGKKSYCYGDSIHLGVVSPLENAQYRWEPGGQTLADFIGVIEESQMFTLITTYSDDCINRREIYLEVYEEMEVQMVPEYDTVVCMGESILIEVKGQNIGKIEWSQENLGWMYKFEPTIDQTLFVQITDDFGCDTIDKYVAIDVKRHPEFKLEPSICAKDSVRLNVSQPDVNYSWIGGEERSEILASESGIYSVSISNECGMIVDETKVIFWEDDCKIYVPNAFSPNNDFNNDLFKPSFGCDHASVFDFRFAIYDRWGNLLYDMNSTDEKGWDGSQHQSGIYSWTLYVENKACGTNKSETGSLLLVR